MGSHSPSARRPICILSTERSERLPCFFWKHWRACGLELNELAEAAGVSRSSVLRFLQMLGFSGYREFRRQLAAVPQTATKKKRIQQSLG